VNGETSLGVDKVSPTLVAIDVPAKQFVEMRVVFPRELLTSTAGAKVEQGFASASQEATLQNASASASATASGSASAEATGLQPTPAYYRSECRMNAYIADENMSDAEEDAFIDEMADRLTVDIEAGGDKDVDDVMDEMGVPAYEEECG
jgi:hypothetical protein